MKSFYNLLVQDNNRPRKVALVAVMRKMLIARLQGMRDWDTVYCKSRECGISCTECRIVLHETGTEEVPIDRY